MADTIFMPMEGLIKALTVKRDNLLNACTLRLYKNDYTPVSGSTLASFTQANFTGYADQAVTDFGVVYDNGANEAETDTGVHTFSCTGTAVSNDIYGWVLFDAANKVIAAARFSAPVPITMNGPGLSISVQVLFEEGRI